MTQGTQYRISTAAGEWSKEVTLTPEEAAVLRSNPKSLEGAALFLGCNPKAAAGGLVITEAVSIADLATNDRIARVLGVLPEAITVVAIKPAFVSVRVAGEARPRTVRIGELEALMCFKSVPPSEGADSRA